MDSSTIETIYRLRHGQGWSIRKIARHLHLSRPTVRRYLRSPVVAPTARPRQSKLDPYKPLILELLERDPQASAVVILQHLQEAGFEGEVTILRHYLKTVRRRPAPRAFLRMESAAGDRFEVDWGHFGSLHYEGDARKLYAFVLLECHSRMLYAEFTHSQCFETFARCHIHAFRRLGGVSRQIWYDQVMTAVAERDGQLIRFQPRFLAFARDYGFYPKVCHARAPWEKGKVEKAGVGYLRQNFWPLRRFRDLADCNAQLRQWLDQVANCRIHRETRQTPQERFQPQALRPLPMLDPDYRDSTTALVQKDLRLHFDGNRYCAPARFLRKRLTVKADSHSVTLYHGRREIVRYPRCWRRGQTLGAQRFERELLEQRPAAKVSQAQQYLITCLGPVAEDYLRKLAQTDRSLSRQIRELTDLLREYGPDAVRTALEKAAQAGAFGSDYIANLLWQQHRPRPLEPPLQLKDPTLNTLLTDPLSLLEYDALIFENKEKEEEEKK